MKSIFKFLGKSILGLAVVFIVFCIYCIAVTKVTPYLYESFGRDTIKVEKCVNGNVSTVSAKESNYGDEFNNERISVLGTFGDSAGFMNAFFSLKNHAFRPLYK